MDKLSSSVGGSMEEGPAMDKAEGDEGQGPPAYFFNRAELQIVRICIDALHFAGFALGSQGIATGILGARPASSPMIVGRLITYSCSLCRKSRVPLERSMLSGGSRIAGTFIIQSSIYVPMSVALCIISDEAQDAVRMVPSTFVLCQIACHAH